MASTWWVYVLTGCLGRTYVGCTTDVARRLRQHNGELKGGAKCTNSPNRPYVVSKVYGPYGSRSEAMSVEYKVKKLRGKKRLEWKDISD